MNHISTETPIVFICNPIAGNGTSLKALFTVKERMAKSGLPYTVEYSNYPGHATELARAAAERGTSLVCAMGGDGTVREVVLGLLGSKTTLAIIPCGTGNDLVKTLQIPLKADAALDILLTGKVLPINYAYANSLPYVNVAGFGFDVDVLDEVEHYKKRTKNGRIAYLKGLFAAIKHRLVRKITYTLDDQDPVTVDALIIGAGNGQYFGGGIRIAPEAVPTDGLLDFTVVHDVYSLKDVISVLPALLNGTIYSKTKYVTHLRGKVLHAECEPFSRIEVDGERVPGTPITFRIADETIPVLVASSYPEA